MKKQTKARNISRPPTTSLRLIGVCRRSRSAYWFVVRLLVETLSLFTFFMFDKVQSTSERQINHVSKCDSEVAGVAPMVPKLNFDTWGLAVCPEIDGSAPRRSLLRLLRFILLQHSLRTHEHRAVLR